MRITLQRGRRKRRFVLLDPPYPENGDTVQWDGSDWSIVKIESTQLLLRLPNPRHRGDGAK